MKNKGKIEEAEEVINSKAKGNIKSLKSISKTKNTDWKENTEAN